MKINPVAYIDPIQSGKKTGRNDHVQGNDRTDSINLSSEAREKAEIYQVVELIKSAPDMDEAKVAELRAKINDPSYINDKVLNATANRIMDAFGI
jgi:negative regulator of flagellin synthesis FlgM